MNRRKNIPTITENAPFGLEQASAMMLKNPKGSTAVSFRSIGYEAKQNQIISEKEGKDMMVQFQTEGEFEDINLRKEKETGELKLNQVSFTID